jgi:uncharacterized coiled-coil DUF342 family protein
MEVIRKDPMGDPKVTSDNFLDFEAGELKSMLDDKNRELIESREQESQLKNLIEDRNRDVRESWDQETILNGLLVKTLDEVGHLKNLLDNKNLKLRESREQEKILKGLLDERDATDAASQNKSIRLETQLVRLETQLSLMTTSYDEATALLKFLEEKCHQISRLKDKYLRKYKYYWAKATSYLQQLSFVP